MSHISQNIPFVPKKAKIIFLMNKTQKVKTQNNKTLRFLTVEFLHLKVTLAPAVPVVVSSESLFVRFF